MQISEMIDYTPQQAFLKSVDSWGAGIVLTEKGNIIDELDDFGENTGQAPTQKASAHISKKQRATGSKGDQ